MYNEPIYYKPMHLETYIIAEIGNNHLCNMDLAKSFILAAKKSKADAIKFQTYKAELLTTEEAMTYWYGEKILQIEYYKKLDKFGFEEYKELFRYANYLYMDAFSSAFDLQSVQMLERLNVPYHKIASCKINDRSLVEGIAKTKKPIILSCGGATIYEIRRAVTWIRKFNSSKITLLFCTFNYPTEHNQVYLKRFISFQNYLMDLDNINFGFSDHTIPDEQHIIPSLAVALGARVIEKHFTLSRKILGSGNFYATEPAEFIKMVNNIRLTENVMGNKEEYGPTSDEMDTAKSTRGSLVAIRKIEKGKIISRESIVAKRPYKRKDKEGKIIVQPDEIGKILGLRVSEDILPDEYITWEKIY